MKTTRVTERNYTYLAAGRAWLVPLLHLQRLPDGTVVLPQAEAARVHLAIANEVCGSAAPLTAEEIEFLCDVSGASYAEVAAAVGVHRSALTRWRASTSPVRQLASRAIKRWFWFRLFGQRLGPCSITLESARDDEALMRAAHDHAVAEAVVVQVRARRAS